MSRLSEKSIELNFCAEFERLVGRRILWFGFTQSQEARLGLDACMDLGGRLLLFQFKASMEDVPDGRRFRAPHHQMEKIRNVCDRPGAAYYALPLVGTTAEFRPKGEVVGKTWLVDVHDLPRPIPKPTKLRGRGLRKSEIHYFDLRPGRCLMKSNPVDVPAISADALARAVAADPRARRRPPIVPNSAETIEDWGIPADEVMAMSELIGLPLKGALVTP